MGRKTRTTDEIAEDPEPSVLVPHQWKYWQFALVLLPLAAAILFLIFLLAGHLLAPSWMDSTGLWPSSTHDIFSRFMLLFYAFFIVGPPLWLAINRYGEFVVWKDGLTLATGRIGPKGSISRRRDIGFYSWSEVSNCSWSHFEPGMLIIHLKETVNRGELGTHLVVTGMMPPMYSFYRVPERYRGAVEKAIRACGKWSE